MELRTQRLRRTTVLCALVALFAVPAPAQAGVRVLAADPLETAVVSKMNQVRRSHGLRALSVVPALNRAAHDHANNMAQHGYFSHDWSNGADFGRWIRRYWPGTGGYRSWSVGENLYWRGPSITARQVVRAWLNSPPHRRNLLKRDWRFMGVGAVQMLNPVGAYAGIPTPTLVAAEFGQRRR
jgi:uncharacterized protein YkwD